MTTVDERRRHARHPFHLLTRRAGGAAEWSENLSAGGVFVRSDTPVPVGTAIELELFFPRWLPALVVGGTVAWARPASAWQAAGYGVEVARGGEALLRLAQLCVEPPAPAANDASACRLMVVRGELAPMATRGRAVIIPAHNGDEALEGLAMRQPDVLLVELGAPLAERLDELRRLREHTERPIVCFGGGDADAASRALHGGADAVLPEAVSHTHLVQTLCCVKRFVGG